MRNIWAVLLLIWFPACVSSKASVLRERLSDGRVVADLVEQDKPTAVLIYSPGDCFACNNSLLAWKALEESGRLRLVLILSRSPTDDDVRSLVIQRLRVAGVLAQGRDASTPSPREYLVDGGAVIASATGMAKTGRNSEILQFAERYQTPTGSITTSAENAH